MTSDEQTATDSLSDNQDFVVIGDVITGITGEKEIVIAVADDSSCITQSIDGETE